MRPATALAGIGRRGGGRQRQQHRARLHLLGVRFRRGGRREGMISASLMSACDPSYVSACQRMSACVYEKNTVNILLSMTKAMEIHESYIKIYKVSIYDIKCHSQRLNQRSWTGGVEITKKSKKKIVTCELSKASPKPHSTVGPTISPPRRASLSP